MAGASLMMKGTRMIADSSLQQNVLDELRWEPSVNAANIGVAAKDGVQIKTALKRNAGIEADDITINTYGGKVTLTGKVHSWNEDSIVTDTAWSAPGVTDVEDRLVIS